MISSTKLKSVDFYRSLRSLSLSLHSVFTPCLCFSNTHFCDMSCTSTLLFLIMFCLRFFFEMLLILSLSSCQNFVIGVGGIRKSASGIFGFISLFVCLFLFNLEGEVVEWWFCTRFLWPRFFFCSNDLHLLFLFLVVVIFGELFQIKMICNLIGFWK